MKIIKNLNRIASLVGTKPDRYIAGVIETRRLLYVLLLLELIHTLTTNHLTHLTTKQLNPSPVLSSPPYIMAPKILIVLTSHDQLGSSGKPTGWYLVSRCCSSA